MDNINLERNLLNAKIEKLREQGLCYTCYDIATGELFDPQAIIYEDDLYRVALELFPRVYGHTIIIYKPHREDISQLEDDEAGSPFQMCVKVIKALKVALGAEKVYLNTMCDGEINHLHFQLFPRYKGDTIGSKRFVMARGLLSKRDETRILIRNQLLQIM